MTLLEEYKMNVQNELKTLKLQGCGSIKGSEKFKALVETAGSEGLSITTKDYGNELYWISLN